MNGVHRPFWRLVIFGTFRRSDVKGPLLFLEISINLDTISSLSLAKRRSALKLARSKPEYI